MYVLAKMTEQRALIAVMTHRQLHVFHKRGTCVSDENNPKTGPAEVWNKFTEKVLAAKLPHHVCFRSSRVMEFTFRSRRRERWSLIEEMKGSLIKFFFHPPFPSREFYLKLLLSDWCRFDIDAKPRKPRRNGTLLTHSSTLRVYQGSLSLPFSSRYAEWKL